MPSSTPASTSRKKVTSVHKANILKYSDGLFLEVSREVAKGYPDIEFEDRIVDNMCMQLVQKPELYDVLVLPNLYGDILSDLCAGLVGGLGVAPGANIGDGGAVFEATHGSAPKYKGQWKMNPVALILSGALMLEHLGEIEAAKKLEAAVAQVIKEGKDVTYDMKADRNDPTRPSARWRWPRPSPRRWGPEPDGKGSRPRHPNEIEGYPICVEWVDCGHVPLIGLGPAPPLGQRGGLSMVHAKQVPKTSLRYIQNEVDRCRGPGW